MTRTIDLEIATLLKENPVVLFMKGTADMPMCGFSGLVCQVLHKFNIPFIGVNILEDPEMRQGIKEYTNWPTLPQLYIHEEFVGGADIVKEMYLSGEFSTLLKEKGLID